MPLEETENEIRARLQNPGKYDPDSFRRSPFPPNKPERGVFAIYGCPKGEWRGGKCQVGVQVQSLRFLKDAGWTLAKARAWLGEHDFKVVMKIPPLTYLASVVAAGDPDEKIHYARVYLIDTGICENNWQITDEALERAAKTLVGKPLTIGHGAPRGSEVGEFVNFIKDNGRLYGLAKITDDGAWGHIKVGDWKAVSVEFVAKKITCSVCGADITDGPDEHIRNRTGHEVIEDFDFAGVALVETPAYPRAKVEEVNGHQEVWPFSSSYIYDSFTYPPDFDYHTHVTVPDYHTHVTVPNAEPVCDFSRTLTAELDKTRQKGKPRPDRQRLIDHFGEEQALKLLDLVGEDAYKLLPERGTRLEQIHDQPSKEVEKKGGKKVTEQENRIAELGEQVKQITAERDDVKKTFEAVEKERNEFKARLGEMEKEKHHSKVAKLLDLRAKAGLVKQANQRAQEEKLSALPDAALDQLIGDAEQAAPREQSKPNPKTGVGEALSTIEQARKRMFGYTRDRMASEGGKIVG